MTTHAVRRTQRVIIVYMAGHAGSRRGRHVGARQSKAGSRVIERRNVGPRNGVMASGAIRDSKRGAGAGVRRIIGLLPGGQVATGVAAIRRLYR